MKAQWFAKCSILGSIILGFCIWATSLLSQNQSDELRKSVKNVKDIISSLEIYENLEKKRLYGAIPRNGAIEFKLQSSPMEKPTSMVVGVATDGTIQEMEIRVYVTNAINEKIRLIRKDLVQNQKDWVFEVMENSQYYLVDIIVKKSLRETALVELVHGFYYGYQSDSAFSSQNQKTRNPSHEAPKQDGDSLFPIDIYNRFEIFRKALWE